MASCLCWAASLSSGAWFSCPSCASLSGPGPGQLGLRGLSGQDRGSSAGSEPYERPSPGPCPFLHRMPKAPGQGRPTAWTLRDLTVQVGRLRQGGAELPAEQGGPTARGHPAGQAASSDCSHCSGDESRYCLVIPKLCFTEPLEARQLGRKRPRWSRRRRKHRPEPWVDGHRAATSGCGQAA